MEKSENTAQDLFRGISDADIAFMLELAKRSPVGIYDRYTTTQLEAELARREAEVRGAIDTASDEQDRATTLPGGNLLKIGQEIDGLNVRLKALQGHSPQTPGQNRFIGGHPIDGSSGMREVNRQGHRHRK